MPKVNNYPLTSFLGVNTEVSNFKLKDPEATDLSNVDVDYRSYLRNRAGIDKVTDTVITDAPHVLGLYKFYKDGVATPLFVCTAGDKIYKLVSTTWTDMVAGLAETGGRWNFITHGNACYGADNLNIPVKITESGGTYSIADWTCSTNNPPDAAPFIIVHRDAIFIAGDPDNASLVVYTTTAATPDIDATGNTGIPINKGDGQKITALEKIGFNLIIFKKHQIHQISGCSSADFTRRQVTRGLGTYSHRSVANTGNTLTFLHDSGIYNFTGTSVQDLSAHFTSKISGIDEDYIQNTCAIYYNKRYWLSYTRSGQTVNDRTLVVDAISGACTEYGYGVNAFYKDHENNLYGASQSGFVRQLNTGTDDDGSDIASYWQSKYFDFGMPNTTKRIKECIVWVSLATEDLTFRFDVDQERQNWSKTITPASATMTEVRFSCNRELVGKAHRLKISHTGDETYKIYQIVFRWEACDRRGTI